MPSLKKVTNRVTGKARYYVDDKRTSLAKFLLLRVRLKRHDAFWGAAKLNRKGELLVYSGLYVSEGA